MYNFVLVTFNSLESAIISKVEMHNNKCNFYTHANKKLKYDKHEP